MSAGDALVDVAAFFGTDTFFGVVSIHNQPLIDRIAERARYIPMRHEASAVNAADAYARVSGGLGVAVTSTGTGAGNAAGSLIEALTAGSRVLHVTGQIDAEFLGSGRGVIHETKDQRAMLAAVSKRATTVVEAPEIGPTLAQAAADAMTAPSGPVSVEIPCDLQHQATPSRHVEVDGHRELPVEALEAALGLIRQAERPSLWIGGGAVGARPEVLELATKVGAAVFTSNAGRGVIDERHRAVVGNFASSAAGAGLLAESDLLVSIGTHHRSNETRHYELPLPGPHIQIDVDAAAIGRAYAADVGIVADSAASIAWLVERLDQHSNEEWTERVAAARAAARRDLVAAIGPYAAMCAAMREVLEDASPLVRDITIPASAWGNRLFPIYDPTTNINPRGGGIGQGVAMGLGAAVARPHVPALLMVGDGGLAVHLGELATVAQESPWLVMLVFNDHGYGVLRNLQDRHFDRRSGVDLATPDFSTLAASFGLGYMSIADPADCREVLSRAVSVRGPVVVEVDCEVYGPMPKPFVPPVPLH